ncbi:MAG TPA: septal ring lytic transglycosylase RlpA family lipoprotein [Bacteroidales bacterium]|nr:septal ring lytic transglycosylase RlpA family lipoprotein [Bacteroidales bacterium]
MRTPVLSICLILSSFFTFAQSGYVQEGKASFYADKFEGRTTASGERYSHSKSTCAHLSLPFGTLVKVTNLSNSKSVIVRVNDRGPFVPNRIIDLSHSAATKLDFTKTGIADVKIEVIDSDGGMLAQESSQQYSAPQPSQGAKRPNNQPTSVAFKEPQKTPVEVAPKHPKPVAASASTETSELYELKVTRLNPQGYAVQIGSYRELVNLLRIADDLKTSIKEEVRVQVATLNGEKIYRLMVGGFPSRREADVLKRRVVQVYPDCFVVELK